MIERHKNPLLAQRAAPATTGPAGLQARAATKDKIKGELIKNAPLGGILGQHTHYRTALKHSHEDLQRVRKAADLLKRLPDPGEALHAIINGTFCFFDVIPALVDLAGARCERLDITTLGFNKRNAAALLREMDAGRIGHVELCCSVLHEALEPGLCQKLWSELHDRGSVLKCARNHTKVQLFEMDDGRAYVIEGSANLRSCAMAEQFMICQDRGLLEFHRSWVSQLCADENTRRLTGQFNKKHVIPTRPAE